MSRSSLARVALLKCLAHCSTCGAPGKKEAKKKYWNDLILTLKVNLCVALLSSCHVSCTFLWIVNSSSPIVSLLARNTGPNYSRTLLHTNIPQRSYLLSLYHLLIHFKLLGCIFQLVLQRRGLPGINRVSSLEKETFVSMLAVEQSPIQLWSKWTTPPSSFLSPLPSSSISPSPPSPVLLPLPPSPFPRPPPPPPYPLPLPPSQTDRQSITLSCRMFLLRLMS